MHINQAADFIAIALNRPAPTMRMIARMGKVAGYLRSGARGVNAPHMNAHDLASFIIMLMSAPDSPAAGLARYEHFSKLAWHDEDGNPKTEISPNFHMGLVLLLEKIAEQTFEVAESKHWNVTLSLNISRATIYEQFPDAAEDEDHERTHWFWKVVDDPKRPAINYMPYFGLGVEVELSLLPMFRMCKVILKGEDDPLPHIRSIFDERYPET
jgi:hypothetical protein